MAAVSEADQLSGNSSYAQLKKIWLRKVKQRLDPKTGLIPHSVTPYNGEIQEGPRGSSQSLMLSFLPAIDSVFAKEQYALYEQYFATHRLGLTAISEYPKGTSGRGDIDSGPVIWGVGGAASIVGQRAAAVNGRPARYKELRNTFEAFGMAFTWSGKKRFVFGQLTVADAFIPWSNALENREDKFPTGGWQWQFQLYSLIVFGILVWLLRKL